MSKTGVALVALGVLTAVACFCWFTDLFTRLARPSTKPAIQIVAQVRKPRSRPYPPDPKTPYVWPVYFNFNGKFGLTEVTVAAVDDLKTNKFPHILWHMISDSNSVPVKELVYGRWPPRGMRLKEPKARPDPLKSDVIYRLTVKAGDQEGSVDFKTYEPGKPVESEQ